MMCVIFIYSILIGLLQPGFILTVDQLQNGQQIQEREMDVCFMSNDAVGEIPQTVRSELYKGQQAFTLDLLAAVQKATPNENIFFSPYSTYHALLLAYFGAKDIAEKELIKALHLEWAQNKLHVSNSYRLEKQMRHSRSKRMPLDFVSTDKIFFDNHIQLLDCMVNYFNNELEVLDFRHNPEHCRFSINSWIAQVTHNEITDFLNEGDITSDTQMVLANSAYFKGQWLYKFDKASTTQEIFYTTKNKYSFVPMMHKRGTYNLAIDEQIGAYILQIPYLTSNEMNKDSEISMIIILPPFIDNSLHKVLTQLKPETLEMALKESISREIEISLPKFEFKQNLELLPILKKLGINSIFNDNVGVTGFSTNTNLTFGDAKHVAKIKVDEEGSTAAAATVLFSFRSARPIEPTKFECNHPFLFLIYDHVTKAILFTGIYRDPKTHM